MPMHKYTAIKRISWFGIPFLVVAYVILLTPSLHGQQILILEDPEISHLMQEYTEWNQQEQRIDGWRIQIINTDDRRKMEQALSTFKYHFPEISYVKWRQLNPYYKVIIGAFETKLEVLAFLQKVKEYFPSAIPIIEKIDEKELLRKQ